MSSFECSKPCMLLGTPIVMRCLGVVLCAQLSRTSSVDEVTKLLNFQNREFVWYWMPALFFSLKNILSYSTVASLGAGYARIASQLKVLITGVLYDAIARAKIGGTDFRRLTETEWVGISVLCMAEAMIAGELLLFRSHTLRKPWLQFSHASSFVRKTDGHAFTKILTRPSAMNHGTLLDRR